MTGIISGNNVFWLRRSIKWSALRFTLVGWFFYKRLRNPFGVIKCKIHSIEIHWAEVTEFFNHRHCHRTKKIRKTFQAVKVFEVLIPQLRCFIGFSTFFGTKQQWKSLTKTSNIYANNKTINSILNEKLFPPTHFTFSLSLLVYLTNISFRNSPCRGVNKKIFLPHKSK